MNRQIEESKYRICQTFGCGAPLDLMDDDFVFLFAKFPDDLDQISYFLQVGVDKVLCEQCQKFTSVDKILASCFIPKARITYFYIPKELVDENLDLLHRVESNVRSQLPQNIEFQVELVHEKNQFQQKTAMAISNLVVPTFIDFVNQLQGGSKIDVWIEQSVSKLDYGFFAGLHLITSGSISGIFALSIDKNSQDDENIKDHYPEPNEMVLSYVSKLLYFRLIELADQLINESQLFYIQNIVNELFPAQIVDRERINVLAKFIMDMEPLDDIPAIHKYTHQALLAAVCNLTDMENPNQMHWAGWYIAHELYHRQNNFTNEIERNFVTIEFAMQTISPQNIWDQFAIRTRGQSLINLFQDIQIWMEISEDLKITQWSGWLASNFHMDLTNMSLESIHAANDSVEVIALREPEDSLLFIESYLTNLSKRDPMQMDGFVSRLQGQLIKKNHIDASIKVTCYGTKLLNERMLYKLAHKKIQKLIQDLDVKGLWPPQFVSTHVMALTEEGNCLRYAGEHQSALQRYKLCRSLISTDLLDSNVRVNERNIAIVLRELGRLGESVATLRKIYPYANSAAEKSHIQVSIGVAEYNIGRFQLAKFSFERALELLPVGKAADSDRLLPLLMIATTHDLIGDKQIAVEAAFNALDLAKSGENLILEVLAIGLIARISDDSLFDDNELSSINDLTIKILQPFVNIDEHLRPPPVLDISLRSLLAERLSIQERFAEASSLLEQTISLYSESTSYDFWKLHAHLATILLRNDTESAIISMRQARQSIRTMISKISTEYDLFEFMYDKSHLQKVVGDVFLASYRSKQLGADDIRLVADFQSSVILSEDLWLNKDRWDIEETDSLKRYQRKEIGSILDLTAASNSNGMALVQVIETSSYLFLAITDFTSEKKDIQLIQLDLDRQKAQDLIEKISFRLAMWSPARQGDPLASITDWTTFASSIRKNLCAILSPGTQLCIVPGPLSGLPLQIPLGDIFPLNYVPSLLIMQLLRQQRTAMKHGINWRPSSFTDFVVWRVSEQPNIVNHFHRASEEIATAMAAAQLSYTYCGGPNGSRENLFQALASTDCVRIACHGRANIDDLRFELLVAANKQLPPQDALALDSDAGQKFLIDWRDFEDLSKSSPIVFSAACTSGMSISLLGGERVGLERSLFRAGTISYVAPQWPVPIADIQALINRILIEYATEHDMTLAQIVFHETGKAISDGMAPWIAQSIATYGDWV